MFMAWGPSGTLFYNEACKPLTGLSSSGITGLSMETVFAGNWHKLGPAYDQVLQGRSVSIPDIELSINRHGYLEPVSYTFSCIPIPQEMGEIGGMLVTATENALQLATDQNSEHYYRRLADTIPVMIWITRPDGYCTYVNQKWYDFTGQPPEKTLGHEWMNVVHPEDVKQMKTGFQQANASQTPFNLEYRIKGADGSYRWILDSGSPMFDKNGVFEGFIGSIIDIDQRKQAEDAVRYSEGRFRQLADSMPQIVWTANADGYVDYYNKQWYLLIGEKNQFGDNSFLVHIHPEDQVRCLETWHEVVRSGEPYEIEYRFKVKYPVEAYRWFLVRARPIRNDSGEIIKWYGTCTDIDEVKTIHLDLENRVTERTHELSDKNKELEETTHELKEINQQLEWRNEDLRQSEERYLRMTNEVEDYAIILLNKDGIIENWNKGAEKIKGYTADDIIGKHFRLFYTHADQQHGLAEKLIEEACLNGKSTYEGLRVRKDGSTFWASTVITALHDDKNDIIGFSKVTRDLTKQKQAEDQLKMYAEQLEQKNRELERSNSELSSFSYVASHDLQEPLRKIQAFGNLIQARDVANLSDTSKDYFDRMVKAALRMQNLIDSLLEFSRTTTARKNFEATDLNVLLDEVKKELAHRIEEKKAEIKSAHLPILTIIPFQFRQLLSNLISNSLKYSREDITPVIEISATYVKARELKEKAATAGKDYFRFKVTDNGIGFEQEYAEKIFELFQRLHGRNEYSGSGIGLAICKKIVENHHGFMRAESELRKGATFYFFIPVK
jgi:PAS domain S-box-containing protein